MARYKGFTYQRNGARNQDKPQANVPKVPPPPPKSIVPTNSKLNIDSGGWLNNEKMLVPMAEIMKIPSQKGKLLKAIEHPPQGNGENTQVVSYQDAPVIFQNWDRGNKKNQSFFLSTHK